MRRIQSKFANSLIPLLSMVAFIISIGSCQPMENSPDEIGDGKVSVSISESPALLINSSEFSCVIGYEVEEAPYDIVGPRINVPNIFITWSSPTQLLKIQNAFVMINFSKGKRGPYQIKTHNKGSTITPVYFINPYKIPCNEASGYTLDQIDSFDGRDESAFPIPGERCRPPSQMGNTYRQICPFKVGGLPSYKEWKGESGLVRASLFLQGNTVPRVVTDPNNITEYPWYKKVDFNIENPCTRFPEVCE